MTSEIRANTLKNRVGLGTVSFTNTGPVVSGIVTANSFSGPLNSTGDITSTGNLIISNGEPTISLTDTDANPDYKLKTNTGHFYLVDGTNNQTRFYVAPDGTSNFEGNLNANKDLSVDGHTNLDNVSIVGVTTAAGILDATNTPASIRVAQDIQHKGDADTYVRFPSNDTITLGTAGGERLRITSNGRIGIGTDTNFTALLNLHGVSNNNATTIRFNNTDYGEGIIQYFNGAMYIKASATTGDKLIQFHTSGSPRLTITSDGSLIIGHTAAPFNDGDPLQLVSTSSGEGLIISNYSASDYGNQIAFLKSRSASVGNTILQSGDRIGDLNFYGNDGSGRSLGAQIQVRVSDTPSNNNTPSTIYFNTGLNQSMSTKLMVTPTDVEIRGSAKLILPSSSSGDYIRMYAGSGTGKWDIYSNGQYLRITDNDSAGSVRLDTRLSTGTAASYAQLVSYVSATGAIPTTGLIQTNNDNHALQLWNGSNSATYCGLMLETRTSGASGWLIANEWKSTYAGDLVFRGRSGGTSSSEALRIQSDGTIRSGGAGPTSDSLRLVLNNPTADNSQMQFQTNATGNTTTDGLRVGYNGEGGQMWLFENEWLRFATSNNERVRIGEYGEITHTRGDNTTRWDVEFRQTGGISNGNYGGIKWTQNSTGGVHLSGIKLEYHDTGRPDLVFSQRNRGGGTGQQETFRIDKDGEHIKTRASTTYKNSQVRTIEFPVYFSSGTTHTVLTLGGSFDTGFVCFAVLEYIGLYAYAGNAMSGGVKRAYTRRTYNNTQWRDFDDQVSENYGENYRPTLYWENGVLKCTVGGSVQITGFIKICGHGNNINNVQFTRNQGL